MQFTSDTILKTLQSVQEARGKKVRLLDDSLLHLRLKRSASILRTLTELNKSKSSSNYWMSRPLPTSVFVFYWH